MAASSDKGQDLQAGMFFVGLSAIIGLTLVPSQESVFLRCVAGGSLFIGGSSLGIPAGGVTNGFLMPTVDFDIPSYAGTIFLTSVGATATVAFVKKTT